jgi:hypothetical protein
VVARETLEDVKYEKAEEGIAKACSFCFIESCFLYKLVCVTGFFY